MTCPSIKTDTRGALLADVAAWQRDVTDQERRDEEYGNSSQGDQHRLDDRWRELGERAIALLRLEHANNEPEPVTKWAVGDPDPTIDKTPGRPVCHESFAGWTCTWHPEKHDPRWHVAGTGSEGVPGAVVACWPIGEWGVAP